MSFLAQLNWSAMAITAMICWTTLAGLQHLRRIAQIWLDGLRVELQIQMVIRGYGTRSEWRGTKGQKGA